MNTIQYHMKKMVNKITVTTKAAIQRQDGNMTKGTCLFLWWDYSSSPLTIGNVFHDPQGIP